MGTTATPLRMGVVGVGVIGQQHVTRLCRQDSPARLVAIADTSPESAAAIAEQYCVQAASSVGELLAREDVDAVVVAIPSGSHAEVAVAALDAGKHVLLEKPIEISVAGADQILAAEQRSGKTLSVVSQRRFAAENQFLHQLIRNGDLGTVTAATVEVALWRSQEYFDSGAWRGTWKLDGGGALMNQGVHLVDLSLWLLGGVEEVYAYTGTLAHERLEVEDTVTVTARLHSGGQLTFLATTTAYGDLPIRMAIMGDGGAVVTESERIIHFVSRSDSKVPEFDEVDQQFVQLRDFITAIEQDTSPLVTGAEARAAVAFIEAVYESARTGHAVRPSQPAVAPDTVP